jgi:hypothetical protein
VGRDAARTNEWWLCSATNTKWTRVKGSKEVDAFVAPCVSVSV